MLGFEMSLKDPYVYRPLTSFVITVLTTFCNHNFHLHPSLATCKNAPFFLFKLF